MKIVLWGLYGIVFLLAVATGVFFFAYKQLEWDLKAAPEWQVFGPENADLTVVSVFDYRCADCRANYPVFMEALNRDGRVKAVVRIFPVQGVESEVLARAAFAAARQGRFREMHEAIMNSSGQASDADIQALAGQVGLDYATLEKDIKSEGVSEDLFSNYDIVRSLMNTTPYPSVPAFLANGILYTPNTLRPDVSDFLKFFAEARNPPSRFSLNLLKRGPPQ